jgi:serine phosphatase RsbU (regulator of sigma subunit)
VPKRQFLVRILDVAFLLFFVLYTAGSVIWLLSGLPPILADRVPAVHETLHRWGAGDQGYVVVSKHGLEQKATATSRSVPLREVAVWEGAHVIIWFENDDPGVSHNLAIYDDRGAGRPIFRGPATTGPSRNQYRVAAPAPGSYILRDELHPSQPGRFVVVETDRGVPAWVRRFPGLTTVAAGAALDSHLVKPADEILLQYLFSVLNVGLGVLLIRLRPKDLAARLLALGMVGTAAVFNFQAHSGLEEMPWLALRLHDNYHLLAGLAYVYALLVFPDGKLVFPWSRPHWFKWPLRVLYLVAITALVVLNRRRFHGDPTGFVLFFGVLIPIAGVTSQAFRLQRATSVAQREQSRVLIWTLSLALAATLGLIGLKVAIDGLGEAGTIRELDELAFLVFPLLFAVIPVTLTVVLVRYRLWDMDRVINQALVYGTLTGVLGLVYVASVVVLQDLLRPITPASNLATVASTLAVAALFRPARDRVQGFIDRRFYRRKYDAAKTLEVFSARLRDEIDLDTVTSEVVAAAAETMQPARMSLWLRPQDGATQDHAVVPVAGAVKAGTSGVVPATTSPAAKGFRRTTLSRAFRRTVRCGLGSNEPAQGSAETITVDRSRRVAIVPLEIARDDVIVSHLEAATGPVEIDRLEFASPGKHKLEAANTNLVVPLISQGTLIGLLGLGPRLSGRDYSSDDRKLLDDLARRAAPALRVAQLVRQLVDQQAAELRARERIEQELRVAQLIQQQFLPRELPALPGWHLAAYYQPARAVGGDFYDFIELPDGQIGLVCGDVAGHGVPAALVMATTHSILRGDAPRLVSPGKVLERANDLLLNDIPPQMFVTCLYGVLDPATGRLRYANAGHNAPYVHTSDGVVEVRATGMPLGLMPAMTYEEKETTLRRGDTLLLHSDGLVEAHDPEREMFGFARLVRLVGGCADGQELIDILLGELDGFTGPGWEQEDDITLVAIQRADLPDGETPTKISGGVALSRSRHGEAATWTRDQTVKASS